MYGCDVGPIHPTLKNGARVKDMAQWCQLLAVQAGGPEFGSPAPTEKLSTVEAKTGLSLRLTAGQSSEHVKCQVQSKTLPQKVRWGAIQGRHLKLISGTHARMHALIHTHACTHTRTHMHTCTYSYT